MENVSSSDVKDLKMNGKLAAYSFSLLVIIVFGILWFLFLAPINQSGIGWFIFSFAAGLSMIVLPCTLPLAFVIVPLSMGKGVAKGVGMALSFGLGITLTLSFYGVFAALFGKLAIGALGVGLESVKNWVYFIAGIFALVFALSEIGLLKIKMPTYNGPIPAFVQKKQDFAKAFFLGLFLGNIGVGCPHPATPLILIEIASSGNVLYGWALFFVHAVGRILPLLFLAFLGILGVNGLSWLMSKKQKVERFTGWAMVFVAGFILTLGLFTHDWWVNSGIHTTLEKLTGEQAFLTAINENLNTETVHQHGVEEGAGLFGLPLWLGNWFLVLVWIAPIWWWLVKEKKKVDSIPDQNMVSEKNEELKVFHFKRLFFGTLIALLGIIFIYNLPHNFIYHESMEDGHGFSQVMDDHDHVMKGDSSSTGDHLHTVLFHDENDVKDGLVVSFLNSQVERSVREKSVLSFAVLERPSNDKVTNLEIEHDKYLHVIGVKSDLTNFFHIHPEDNGSGIWQYTKEFKDPGYYYLWSDAKRDGENHSFSHPKFMVSGDATTTEEFFALNQEFLKNVMVGEEYQVGLDHDEPLSAERPMTLVFDVGTVYGNGVEVEDYLGAKMHLAVISNDLKHYIHTHPDNLDESSHEGTGDVHDESIPHEHSSSFIIKTAQAHEGVSHDEEIPNTKLSFKVTFPEAGIYKLFAQFRPAGIDMPKEDSLVAEFFVKVLPKDEYNSPLTHKASLTEEPSLSDESKDLPKSVLFVLSVALIIILGFGVNKYINKE